MKNLIFLVLLISPTIPIFSQNLNVLSEEEIEVKIDSLVELRTSETLSNQKLMKVVSEIRELKFLLFKLYKNDFINMNLDSIDLSITKKN